MPTATLRHSGDVRMIDYTNGTNVVNAGDIIVSGSALLIAHKTIGASENGSLAAGGGVYVVPKATNDAGLTLGVIARWNAGTNLIATSATALANLPIGPVVKTAATTDSTVEVLHVPNTGNL